jgi:hypothetical protein
MAALLETRQLGAPAAPATAAAAAASGAAAAAPLLALDAEDGLIEAAGLMQRLRERVGESPLGKMEPAQLAALVALSASLATKASGGSLSRAASVPGHGVLSLQQLGQEVPEGKWSDFEPALCARLQNFGGSAGYRAVYLGRSPCNAAGNAGSEQLAWGKESALTVDCRLLAGDGTPALPSPAPAPATVAGRLQAAAAKAATDLSAALHRTMQCSLAVASEGGALASGAGSGALVRHSAGVQLVGGPKLNAVRVRLCNVPPSTIQYPAALRGNNSTVELHSLRLNGHALVGAPLRAAQAGGGPEGCRSHVFRVPARSLSEGFVLSGWMELEQGVTGVWGVGEQSSVEIQFGEFTLGLHASLGAAGGDASRWQMVTAHGAAALQPPAGGPG